jgi:hypothetical protein
MELEDYVYKELIKNGYYVQHKNLTIIHKNEQITEYDIISTGFAIEVKSGKAPKFKLSQQRHQILFLPKNYKLYYYCPNVDDENLENLNFCMSKIIFVNKLEDIYKNHPPYSFELNIKDPRAFIRLLSLTFDIIKCIGKIHINKIDFYHVYLSCKYMTDHYNIDDNVKNSFKCEYLIENNIINLTTKFNRQNTILIAKSASKKIEVTEICSLKTNYHHIEYNKKNMHNIALDLRLPLIENLTQRCKCCKTITLSKILNKDVCRKCILI